MKGLATVRLDASTMTSLTYAAERYTAARTEAATGYLASRGIDPAVAEAFQLGCVTEPEPGHERYTGWLSIPYMAGLGVVGFKFRRIDGRDGPKYGAPLGQPARLFNTRDLFKPSPVIVLTEGELDAVVVSGCCDVPAVGVPGVNAWKRYHPRLFDGYEKVLVVGDNDVRDDGTNPGQDFTLRVVEDVPQAVAVVPPAGMDVTDVLVRDGVRGVRALLGANR